MISANTTLSKICLSHWLSQINVGRSVKVQEQLRKGYVKTNKITPYICSRGNHKYRLKMEQVQMAAST